MDEISDGSITLHWHVRAEDEIFEVSYARVPKEFDFNSAGWLIRQRPFLTTIIDPDHRLLASMRPLTRSAVAQLIIVEASIKQIRKTIPQFVQHGLPGAPSVRSFQLPHESIPASTAKTRDTKYGALIVQISCWRTTKLAKLLVSMNLVIPLVFRLPDDVVLFLVVTVDWKLDIWSADVAQASLVQACGAWDLVLCLNPGLFWLSVPRMDEHKFGGTRSGKVGNMLVAPAFEASDTRIEPFNVELTVTQFDQSSLVIDILLKVILNRSPSVQDVLLARQLIEGTTGSTEPTNVWIAQIVVGEKLKLFWKCVERE